MIINCNRQTKSESKYLMSCKKGDFIIQSDKKFVLVLIQVKTKTNHQTQHHKYRKLKIIIIA